VARCDFLLKVSVSKHQLHRFHVPFWLSHILVHLFYFSPSFYPSWKISRFR